MEKYTLVNPVIQGTMETSFESKNRINAAGKAYDTMSKYFSNNMPHFNFTLKKGSKFFHFNATEKLNDKGKIKTEIKEVTDVKNENKLDAFITKTQEIKGGGKKKYKYDDSDSDSSDSDSESSDYKYYRPMPRRSAIDYWHYYPYIYQYDYLYVPQFINTVTPYVEIILN